MAMTLDELNATAPLLPVFFNYDEAELLPAGQATLQQNAEWMRRWTSTSVRIEGTLRRAGHQRVQPGARR